MRTTTAEKSVKLGSKFEDTKKTTKGDGDSTFQMLKKEVNG